MNNKLQKYDIIYADNPWRFSSRPVRSGRYSNLPYETLSLKQLTGMNVQEFVQPDAALFLWVPGALLMDAGEVITAWGFKYIRVESTWEKKTKSGKKRKVCGPWGMNEAEYLLMGVRGSMCSKQTCKANFETVVSEVYPGKHSAKPEIFRKRIERRFSWGKRLELFARKESLGWDVFGNEVKSDVEIYIPKK